MSIQSELKKWASSPAGKKKIAMARMDALASGESPSSGAVQNGGSLGSDYIRQCIRDVEQSVIDQLPPSLAKSIDMDSFQEPVIKARKDGSVAVSISFKPDVVHRDSLVPKVWKDGVQNIVMHLSTGWSARGSVYGEWHGIDTYSRSDYAGDDFMRDAVNAFNNTHQFAYAELNAKYSL